MRPEDAEQEPAQPERTPEQRRADRRAGIGCAGFLVIAALAMTFGGYTQLSDAEGTRTQARILNCDPRPNRMPFRCRGIWSVGDRRFKQGYVDGATSDDIGKRIDIVANGDDAERVAGRTRTAVILFVLAALALGAGVGVAKSMRSREP